MGTVIHKIPKMRNIKSFILILVPCLATSVPEGAPSFSSNSVAERGYNPGLSGGQGYNPGGGGGQGYNPGVGGGQGYNPGLAGHDREQAPVVFTANRATAYSRTGPGQLMFERSVTNLGGGWNGATGQFITPYSGAYHFSWSALSTARHHLKLALVRGGREQVASWADSDGYQAASGAAVITLRRGDTVYLYVEEGEVYESSTSNTGYTTFSGF